MSEPPALEVVAASVRFGAVDVLARVSMAAVAGAIVGLVGPNGAGKTTLLDAAGGLVPLASGAVRLGGVDVTRLRPHQRARLGLGRTFQALELFEDLSVAENVLVAAEAGGVRTAHNNHTSPLALSHGARKTLALDRALAGRPRVLLLDEPAAGLDPAGRAALTARLRAVAAGGVAVVLADHDLDLVMALCDEVTVLDFGRAIAHGPPAQVRADPAVVGAYLGNTPVVASRPHGTTPGDTLLAARGLRAGYRGAPVLQGVDFEVRAGEVVALLGPNGAGKTTTLRALSGTLAITAGDTQVLGATLPRRPHALARLGLAHVPQDRAVLPSLTVAENLRLVTKEPAAALDAFPELRPLLGRRAGALSGGERHLLAAARALARKPSLLLLDEPSMGLAPRAARRVLDAARAVAATGGAVLLAEQHPPLALEVADRAVVLSRGTVAYCGPATTLAARPEILRAAYFGAD